MSIQVTLTGKKKRPQASFEAFLRRHKLKLVAERISNDFGYDEFRVTTRPSVRIRDDKKNSPYYLVVERASLANAIETFVEILSRSHEVSTNSGRSFFKHKSFVWDGIMQVVEDSQLGYVPQSRF